MLELTRNVVETVWRMESARLIGGLARLTRDLTRAEDLAQEALMTALERWPEDGIPNNPGAWLMTAAKHRAYDQRRHDAMTRRTLPALVEGASSAPGSNGNDLDVDGDDVLRLLLVACHPILSAEARVALTLRLVGGLTTDEIARAFLVPEPTIAQRIVRAKRTLSEARVPFDVPIGAELRSRIPSVCEVLYLVFNEGYSATSGERLLRTELCDEALRVCRILVARVSEIAEVHGLLALMEFQASRHRSRIDRDGEPVLLMDQDRSRWDYLAIERGRAALARAEARAQPLGPYTLQAAIASCHATARTADATDWQRIVALYDALVELTHSPVVELNRAVAVSMAIGPSAGLALVDELATDPTLERYHWLPSVRGDLLMKLGRRDEARREFERAAFMTNHARERAALLARAKATGPVEPTGVAPLDGA
jgi:RNA polymerase sigma factor (sigma-70 family)